MPGVIQTAFTLPDPLRWTGGYHYFVNLFRVLRKHGSGSIRPIVFVGDDSNPPDALPIIDHVAQIVRSADFSATRVPWRLVNALLSGSDGAAARAYRRHGVEVAFESARYHGWRFPFPTIAWLPDFQHRRLPHVFSRKAWLQREIGFRAQIASARVILLSSQASRRECETYYPGSRPRLCVVPFAVELPPEALRPVDDAGRRYGLPARYFYLPNQFWAHKNHGVVIEAVKLLQQRGVQATVAASGALADYRRPGLLRELEARVAALGIGDRFRFLGLVPRTDVYALMREAVALVNPSLSEGWSTVVEEARSLDVPMVLSDIEVHREQAGDCAVFFDPHSPEAAAGALEAMLARPAGRAAKSGQAQAADAEERLRTYALAIEAVIREAVA